MSEQPWLTAESYWQPPLIVPSAWHEHAPFASWLIAAARPESIVELGTHNGFSFFVFCEAVSRLELDCRVVATDSWQGDEHAGFYSEEVYRSVVTTTNDRYPDIGVLHRGWFDDFVDSTPDGSIDILHIDGRHRYEDVLHDFESWLPKLSDRAIALFHDTAEHKRDFGVHRFWAEVGASYPSFAFEHGHGLGVLGVGSALPDDVRALFDADEATARRIRTTYHELGAAVSGRYHEQRRGRDVERRLHEVEPALREAEAALREARTRVADLESSTSWRITAPARWVSGLVRRQPDGSGRREAR